MLSHHPRIEEGDEDDEDMASICEQNNWVYTRNLRLAVIDLDLEWR
jgi:hypothetical protein